MKTALLASVLTLTVGCSGAGKLYVGDLTTTIVENGTTYVKRDANASIDVQQTARGGLLVDELSPWGVVHLDRVAGTMGPDAYQLGYAPKMTYSEATGTRETFKFTGDFSSASATCGPGSCQVEIRGRGEWKNIDTGTVTIKEVSWNFSGLAY